MTAILATQIQTRSGRETNSLREEELGLMRLLAKQLAGA
jgi:hypothetical protein